MQIDAPCLDCGEPMTIRMRDGEVLEASPESIVGHANVPVPRWRENWPFT